MARMAVMKTRSKLLADIDFTLRKVFGKPSFRAGQREIIEATLDGRDIFVQAATSFGKSLCYQLPAVIDHGITIVISPLLALMENQVVALQRAGIDVATINSTTSQVDRDRINRDLECGHPKTRLLYVTPELLLTDRFRSKLDIVYSQNELARVAIDEAHCISEWGHEFRLAYQQLSYIRHKYPTVPIMCLTATATPQVREDIMQHLGFRSGQSSVFLKTTNRRNLHYRLEYFSDDNDSRFAWILSFLQHMYARRATPKRKSFLHEPERDRVDAVSGIIYAGSRIQCDKLAEGLRQHGVGAASYHARIPAPQRDHCQRKWLVNAPGYDIIVATTAFGMGIDKKDVRFVIHWSLPKSFEAYYQEAGRAGRDGKAALCMLLYSREDRNRVQRNVERCAGSNTLKDTITSESLAANLGNEEYDHGPGRLNTADLHKAMQQFKSRTMSFQALSRYCEQTDRCRHVAIGQFFGEDNVQTCDQCCDFCFATRQNLSLRAKKRAGLSSEEWASSQTEHHMDSFDDYA